MLSEEEVATERNISASQLANHEGIYWDVKDKADKSH